MYFCDDKAELSEIILISWFGAQETFLIIINVVVLNIIVESMIYFIFRKFQKNSIY